MQIYDYAHRAGFHPISWEAFGRLSRALAEAVAREEVDLAIGIARGGLFPASAVACALRRELFPVRLTRRVDDRVVHPAPVWRTAVAGKAVAIVDEIADTGETLRLVATEVERGGATRVVTAALVAHTWATPAPRICALETDALVVFPWDGEVLVDGIWQVHPELASSLPGGPEIEEAPTRERSAPEQPTSA